MDQRLIFSALLFYGIMGFVNTQVSTKSLNKTRKNELKAKLDDTKALLREIKNTNKKLKQENKRLKRMVESNKKLKDIHLEKENDNFKTLLKETKAANRRLKEQNKRQIQVWYALHQMCKALKEIPSDAGSGQNEINDKSYFNIHLISMSSKEKRIPVGSKYNISVKYTVKRKPEVQWTILTLSGGTYMTSGWTEYDKRNKTYVSGIELDHQLLLSRYILFRIYNSPNFVDLVVNMSAILHSQTNTIEYDPLIVEGKSNLITAPLNDNLTESFYLKGNLSVYTLAEAYISGVNYSSNPPTVFEVGSFNEDIDVDFNKISNLRANVTVNAKQHITENGGTLTLFAEQRPAMPQLYESVRFGTTYEILSGKTRTAVRPGFIGLYPLENISVLYPPFHSIVCLAMGYKRPEVSLVRDTGRGMEEIIHNVHLIPDRFTVLKAFTIYTNDTKAESNYTCMASIKNETVTSKTEVIIFEQPIFNEQGTGIITNSSEQVTIGCSVTGKPLPKLELRLNTEYGPDLSNDPRFKTIRSNSDAKTATLMVTMEPVVKDIYKVYCYADSGAYKEIQIFPEHENRGNWGIYNV